MTIIARQRKSGWPAGPKRQRRGGWTPERRARQSQLIKSWKPWKNSTGPRTPQGKKAASLNALKHGNRRAAVIRDLRHVRALLREQAAWLKQLKCARIMRGKLNMPDLPDPAFRLEWFQDMVIVIEELARGFPPGRFRVFGQTNY